MKGIRDFTQQQKKKSHQLRIFIVYPTYIWRLGKGAKKRRGTFPSRTRQSMRYLLLLPGQNDGGRGIVPLRRIEPAFERSMGRRGEEADEGVPFLKILKKGGNTSLAFQRVTGMESRGL